MHYNIHFIELILNADFLLQNPNLKKKKIKFNNVWEEMQS